MATPNQIPDVILHLANKLLLEMYLSCVNAKSYCETRRSCINIIYLTNMKSQSLEPLCRFEKGISAEYCAHCLSHPNK